MPLPSRLLTVSALCALLPLTGFSAEKTSLRHQFSASKQSQFGQPDLRDLHSRFNLSAENQFISLELTHLPSASRHERLQQHYRGIPVWGEHINITSDLDGKAIVAHGNLFSKFNQGLDQQIDANKLSPDEALRQAINYHLPTPNKAHNDMVISDAYSELNVFIDENQKAKLAYVVSFFSDLERGGAPQKPVTFIDAQSGEILKSWNGLNHLEAQGPGGNEKTGIYYYGSDLPSLTVNEQCEMLTANVKTMDFSDISTGNVAFKFDCPENNHKAVNGAFAPLNDAHYFSEQVFSLFEEIYEVPVLNQQLTVRVHYGNNYQNAFYSGNTISLGDGAFTVHPLTSLDIIAHEISHGFTENHSGLIYSGQSGAINESFSDMAGEAAEFFVYGENDFLVGEAVRKSEGGLRDMANPRNDGRSIDHADDYLDGYNVHYASGIFNKAFYLIATANEDWDTLKAFEIFVNANRFYWSPSNNFDEAACGVIDATFQLGYDTNVVANAFAAVGVQTCLPGPKAPTALFSATVDGLGVSFTNLSQDQDGDIVSYLWDFGDGTTSSVAFPQHQYENGGEFLVSLTVTDNDGLSANFSLPVTVDATVDEQALVNGSPRTNLAAFRREEQHFYIDVPAGANSLIIAMGGGGGDADLYVRYGSEATSRRFDCRPYLTGNEESCEFTAPTPGRYWVMLRAYRDYSDVSLMALYIGGSDGEGDGNSGQENTTSTPIPDNNMTGISTEITVTDSEIRSDIQVSVDIEHTYIGDLIVDLVTPSGQVYNLHNRSGGSTQNLNEVYNIAINPESSQGQWSLRVRDMAQMDTGTLQGWSLSFP